MASHCLEDQVQTPWEGSQSLAGSVWPTSPTSPPITPLSLGYIPWEHSLLFHAYLLFLHQEMLSRLLPTW